MFGSLFRLLKQLHDISCRSKYELQEFLKPSLRINSANKSQETPKISVQTSFSRKILDSFRSNPSKPAVNFVTSCVLPLNYTELR